MDVKKIFNDALDAGVVLFLEAGALKYQVRKGGLPDGLKAELKKYKQEIIDYLLRIDAAGAAEVPDIVPCDRSAPLLLSYAQQRLWMLDQIDGGSAHYNMAGALRLRGALDQDALARAFSTIVERHESLRTCFVTGADGQPLQQVRPAAPLAVPLVDLRALEGAARQARLQQLAAEQAARGFDLQRDLMLRVTLVQLADDDFVLLSAMHHIAADGWSMAILVREFCALYQAYAGGQDNPLPPLAVQYADYAQWQRQWLQGEVLERQLGYWSQQLERLPAVHGLPLDRPRPKQQSFAGAGWRTRVDGGQLAALQALCQAQEATLFMGLHAAFAAFLARCSNERDIVVGSPIANREQAEVAGLIGFFVNTLVLRADLSGQPAFTDLIAHSKRTLLAAYAHQQVSFEQLVERLQPQRSLSHSPLFQIMLVLQNNEQAELVLPGLTVGAMDEDDSVAKYDLTLHVTEAAEGLQLNWEYNRDLFEAATVERMGRHFGTLLAAMLAAPGEDVFRLPMLDADERRQQLVDWNRVAPSVPDGCIHHLFEQQAARTPQAPAVACAGARLTYAELNARANRLAHYLVRQRRVGPEVLVGVCLDRSLEMVVAILAVLKAGGAYVPLDPDYPAARLAFMLDDAKLDTVLTHSALRARLALRDAQALCLDQGPLQQQLALEPDTDPSVPGLGAGNLAYVIYTSGSTGQPKGVLVEHRSLVASTVARLGYYARPLTAFLLLSPCGFDSSVAGIFWTLVSGACLVVPDSAALGDLPRLCRLIAAQRVNYLLTVPSFYQEILAVLADAGTLQGVILAGEALPPALASAHAQRFGDACLMFNEYGPTEATVWSTVHALGADAGQAAVPIGRSPNLGKLYVCNDLQLAPVGTPGELLIGGVGLARGYLDRPQLTAQKFIDNPFHDSRDGASSTRLYRTGDLVRWRADGALEFLGRIDDQVKIRGFRIELGEIENRLLAHPAVQEAVVLARGGDTLVAYVAGSALAAGQASAVALRAHLADALPDYMLPSAIMVLERLPLTPHGKVDRKALPEPDLARLRAPYAPPRSDLERQLCQLWQEILGLEQVGLHDNFFQLGGHSLSATRLAARIQQQFQRVLPLKLLFQAQTLEQLAHAMLALDGSSAPPLLPVARDGLLPASYSQQRLWLLDRIDGGSAHYNMPGALALHGTLERDALQRALTTILARHESLRTCLREGAHGVVEQVIQAVPDGGIALPLTDLSQLAAGERQLKLSQWLAEESGRGFDLARDLMLRAHLLKLADDEHVLLVTMHHIASDGWSMAILIEEFSALYGAYARGQADPLPPLPVQYADYAHWQRSWLQGEVLERQLDYWAGQLAGLPVVHSLPLDHPRPPLQTFAGDTFTSRIAAPTSAALRALCQAHGATLFMGLHAAFSVLLARYSNETDIVVGSPIANREQAEIAPLIGFFTNTLVLRSDLSGAPGFLDLLEQSKRTLLDAYAHQQVPFEQVVERVAPLRNLNHGPLFQVLLALQNNPEGSLSLPGLTMQEVAHATGVAKYDLSLTVAQQDDALQLAWEYNSDLFEPATIARMAAHFDALLAAFTDDPAQSVFRAPMLGAAERSALLADRASTAAAFPDGLCLHELFERQAARTPDAVAARCGDEALSYAQLNARANRLAHYLAASRGVGPDTVVGLCLERSLDMLVAMLAILKAGGAYLPLDPRYPQARLAYMMEDARLATILTQAGVRAGVAISDAQALCLDDAPLQRQLDQQPDGNLAPAAIGLASCHLAYVIHTSGSTGNPKGVMIEHRNVVNFLESMRAKPGIAPHDCLLAVTSTSFDIHVLELFLPLVSGATVQLASSADAGDPARLAAAIARHGVTIMQATPATWKMLVDAHWQPDAPLKALCGGEALSQDLARALLARPGLALWNMYGPTETTVWSCTGQVLAHERQVLLGQPIANTELLVVSPALELAPAGVAGELLIGGAGVARGYLNRPDLTAERFIEHPLAGGGRLYRTGDLVRRLANGALEFLGRIDHQVKVRGFRIELGEIEARLRQHPQVGDAVVTADPGRSGERQLVAYVVPRAGAQAERALAFSLFYFGADTYAPGNKYQLYLDAARFADEHGFEAVWTPERHFDTVGSLYPNPSILNAALATVTSRVQLRAGSVVLPLHDPLRVAEEWSVVDNLSNGRVGLSVASGWHPRDFVLAPERFAPRKQVMHDGIGELRALWRGASVARQGGNGAQFDVRIFPKPIQDTLPIWVTAAGNPDTFAEAGRMGCHLLTHLLGQTIEEVAQKVAVYRQALADNGYDPQQGRVTLMIHTFMGEDLEATLDAARQPFINYMRQHISLLMPLLRSLDIATDEVNEADLDNVAGFAFERYARTAALIGTPASVAGTVARLQDAGVDELACLIDWMDGAAAYGGLASIAALQRQTRMAGPGQRALAAHCGAALPHYMVPSTFMTLAALPLTPNGKVDRKALPNPDSAPRESGYVAPHSATEHALCAIWQQVLGLEQVGIGDSFFQLGGTSLLAMRVLAQIRSAFGIDVPVNVVFANPTIEAIASYIDALTLNSLNAASAADDLTEQGTF